MATSLHVFANSFMAWISKSRLILSNSRLLSYDVSQLALSLLFYSIFDDLYFF